MVSLASLCGCRSRKTREYPFLLIFISCFCCWEDGVPVFLNLWCTLFVFSFVNRHDCSSFMLQNVKTHHCREDGVIQMLDYTHEDILVIRKTLLYTCTTSDVFDVDFRGLCGIEPSMYAWPFVFLPRFFLLTSTVMNSVFEPTLLCAPPFFIAGEWLDLGENHYKIFGSQFSELERLAIDLSQGRSLEKTKSGVMKGGWELSKVLRLLV